MDLSYHNPRIRSTYHHLPVFLQEWLAALYARKVYRRRFGDAFQAQLEELVHDQALTIKEKNALQFSRLKDILVYSADNVPYYRKLFSDIHFNPKNIKSIEDLRIIPPLEKDCIRNQHEQLLSETYHGPTMHNSTSGTTGKALNFVLSEEANQRHYACLWFHFGWADVHQGDRTATFGAHPLVSVDRSKPPFWLYDSFDNDLMFSAIHLNSTNIPAYVQALQNFKPKMIRGYVSHIYLIALHLLETKNSSLRPNAVFTYAETLQDRQREVIQKAFNCPVYSSYGNGERTGMLLQCEQGNFHVVQETCLVEVVREDSQPAKPGEIGELVITSLINKAMPFIRYRIGDTGIIGKGSCKCGRTSPIFTNLTGRVDDFIVTPDGRHLVNLNNAFQNTDNAREVQIVQEARDFLRVKVVPRVGFSPSDGQLILNEMRERVGSQMKIQLELVKEIPRTAQSKFKLVVSKVPVQFKNPI